MFSWLKNTARNEQRQLFVDKSPRALEPESRKVQIMARRGSGGGSGDGSGGGGDDSKKSVAIGFLQEAAEFATGVMAGSALHSIMRAGASGALRGLKSNLFESLFGRDRSKDEKAKAEELTGTPGKLLRSITNASGDAKLGQLAQDYMSSVIAIQSSGRNETDKAKAIEEAKAKLKASVNEHLLAKSKSSLQNLMAELSDTDQEIHKQVLLSAGLATEVLERLQKREEEDASAHKVRIVPAGRPGSYKEDWSKWYFQELDNHQRDLVSIRLGLISVNDMTTMLDGDSDKTRRLNHFLTIHPRPVGRVPPINRPYSYREDFFKWLQQELTPAQRQLVMARRGKISSIRVITDMLDYSGNAQDRFTYFQFALGQPEVKELAGEIAQAAVTGTLSEHPFIKGLATSSRHGANVRTIQQRVTAARRSRWNKL